MRPPTASCSGRLTGFKEKGRASFHFTGQHVLVLSGSWMQETVSELKWFYWLFLLDTYFYEFLLWLTLDENKVQDIFLFY